MTRRRITLTLGAAAAGLLGAWLAPAAAAFADSFDVDPASTDPVDPAYTVTPIDGVEGETVTGFKNMLAAPPAQNGAVQGYQHFDIMQGGKDLGTVYGYESTSPYLGPNLPGGINAEPGLSQVGTASQVLYVDSDVPGGSSGVLPNGSVIATWPLDGTAYENVYSAIPSPTSGDPATVTDYLVNTTTNQTINLSGLVNDLGITDAANTTPALPDYITGVGDPTVTGVGGLPPLTIALSGTQEFSDDAAGQTGDFNAVETTTTDGFGFHTEALLVTQDINGSAPAVGSVFNTIDLGHLQNVYSSIPGADGKDVVTDILTNTKTDATINLSSLFTGDDASAGLTDGSNVQSFFDGTGYTIVPDGQETFTGVDGLPPSNASIQGTEQFEVYHNGVPVPGETFTADVTTVPQMALSNDAEALLVTSDDGGTGGTAPGDLPPVGSVFDIQSDGYGDEHVYSDLAATSPGGHDVISDWFVTPIFGNFNLSPFYQDLDAADGLNKVSFADALSSDLFPNSSADALSTSAASSADALAASVDPSAAASLADPFPHIDAALQFLAGLF